MKLKRIAATVSASFEDALSKIENHEAVAQCAIDDMRKAVAQIKVQTSRAQAELKKLQGQQAEATQAITDWQQRALSVADQDEAKALQCLERAEQQEARSAALAEQIDQHQSLVDELQRTLQEAEGQLQTLNLKRSSLAARDARSRSLRKVERAGCNLSSAQVFDRWETAVLTEEALDVVPPFGGQSDPLQQAFAADEQQARLQDKLAALRAQTPPAAS